MSKNLNDLIKSRKQRELLKRKFGFIPTSIVPVNRSLNKKIIQYVSEDRRNYFKKEKDKLSFYVSGAGVRGSKQAGLSIMPYNIISFVLKFYSERGDNYFDPCFGHGARMQVARILERNYYGCDVSKEFYEFVKKKIEPHLHLLSDSETHYYLRDSRDTKLESESMDIIFTSPPYWDIEYYGDEPEQLGYKKTYQQFLSGLSGLIDESYRLLKKGKFAIFNVADFKKDKKYYNYHSDIAELGKKAGFELHDIAIMDWKTCLGQVFINQYYSVKLLPKRHEYLVVFKK